MGAVLTPGALVLFHGKPAKIENGGTDKIEIRTAAGDTKSVRPKDVEFLHPGPVSSLSIPDLPEPDWKEILELMDGGTFSFRDFAELAWGAFSPAAALAAWNTLQNNLYFTGTPEKGVTPKSAEEIGAMQRKLQEKVAEADRREALLNRIRNNALEPDDRKSLREVELVARGESESSRLLRDLGIEAVPEAAHRLLLRLGVWDELYDPWPPRLGVSVEMPESALPALPEETRTDLTGHTSFAIDDQGSNDPDDAIAFDHGLLYVHVADPAAAVVPGCAADEEASWRGESSYLPEKMAPMLPEGSVAQFGLGINESSPAMSFAVSIDAEGKAHLEKIELATVRTVRCNYENAHERIPGNELAELQEALERFRNRRAEAGALFIRLPEVKTKVENGEITITPCPVTPERELVANAMLAAGAAVAEFMAREGIPFPFVTQAPPEIELSGLGDSLADMFALRRNCSAGVVNTTPGLHCGLGLEPYSRVTSPLRRYADLLAHQQIRRYLKHEELFDSLQLESRLSRSEEAGMRRRKLEKYADEFYLLHYLARHPEWEGEGTIVDKQGERLTVLIPEFAYEYKCRLNGKGRVGDEVSLKFLSADPAALKLHLRLD